ncbi:MAG: transcription elongation factor greA [Chlamydiota bacterium]|jgi:transcription elongation factor GreA-like protein/transcription elongation GreA/GreB family factor
MSYLKDFKAAVAHRNYPNILKLWEEYCQGDELDTDELIDILKLIKGSEFAEPFGREVERILPLWETVPTTSPHSHDILLLIVDLATTSSDTLTLLVQNYLTTHYGHEKNFSEKLKIIGFRSKEKIQGVLGHYELLSHFSKGNYVFHEGGWGVGEILDVSFLREQVTLEFDCVPGKKEMSFATAFKMLVPIPKTHFLALRFGSADALEKRAKEDPLSVMHLLLRDLGPKTAAEIKEELCELVIPEKEWAKWWQAARSKLKKDTLVSAPADLKDPFVLHKKGITHEDRLKSSLERPLETADLIQVLYSAERDFADAFKHEDLKALALSKVQEALSHNETTPPHRMELLFLKQTLDGAVSPELNEMIEQSSSIEALIEVLDVQAFKKKALMEVRKHRSDWEKIFLNLLFQIDAGSIKDYLLTELLAQENSSIKNCLSDLYAHPEKHPETFLWYFQKLQTQKAVPFNEREGKIRFFEGLLTLLSAIEHKSYGKDFVKKILHLITDGRFALVRQMMQQASQEEVKEFILLASKCHSLADHDQKIFQALAEVVYPALGKGKKQEATDASDVIWTTQEGYDNLKKNIERIATVESVANAQEIEAARAHGDLRENAEFKAALEKRDRLQAELKLLSDQLKCARVISVHDVSIEEVGVGTIVTCSNKQGKSVIYTLLGPWDANPDKHILSFQSKLAQAMKGKKVGAKIAVPGDELTILSIQSVFDT